MWTVMYAFKANQTWETAIVWGALLPLSFTCAAESGVVVLLLEVQKVNGVKNLTFERLNEICSGSISYSTTRQ